ncbi:hypothetical protein BV22DRAFT_1044955 [Leucogyrophana mollusca]|uniref:Uncharacterized protein n=1 Tax=Leucogyrophana mollusca TaxID=85980 RepID=A0ACB8BT22_9AGAM|nr:hypothetical protein BV22DRAFT_1044955 [Leucogyrophana mollusca]
MSAEIPIAIIGIGSCSASATAMHLALSSIERGEIDQALVVGGLGLKVQTTSAPFKALLLPAQGTIVASRSSSPARPSVAGTMWKSRMRMRWLANDATVDEFLKGKSGKAEVLGIMADWNLEEPKGASRLPLYLDEVPNPRRQSPMAHDQ